MGYITRRVLQKDTPIIIGYLVLGMACGMLGEKAGLSPFLMFVMSVLAFAGRFLHIHCSDHSDG